MTGIHDKRATRSSKRRKRSCPQSEPPSPPHREREDAAAALPPARRRAEAPVPPPEPDASVRTAWPRTAYVLRNREPYIPARHEKREELKHDLPCSSKKILEEDEPWEAPACARAGLEHYNSMNQGGEHELVKAVGVYSFLCCGMWLHANFLARRKGANNCVDLVPKYFFAELNLDGCDLLCSSCVKIDSVESKNLGGCRACPERIMHPAAGVYLHAQPRRTPPAESGLQISFSF